MKKIAILLLCMSMHSSILAQRFFTTTWVVIALYTSATYAKREYKKNLPCYNNQASKAIESPATGLTDRTHDTTKNVPLHNRISAYIFPKKEAVEKFRFIWRTSNRFKLYTILTGIFSLKLFNTLLNH
jgi:hypothetical protein